MKIIAILMVLAFNIFATVGSEYFDTMPSNEWVEVPAERDTINYASGLTLTLPMYIQGHANITVDTKNKKLIHFGNDTHNLYFGNSYYNVAKILDLETLKWEPSHEPDSFDLYTYKDLGTRNDTAFYVPITTTGHPVAGHAFDAPIYIPGTDYVLITFKPAHAYGAPYFQNASDSLYLTSASVVIQVPGCWLYNTVSKEWTNLNSLDHFVPNLFSSTAVYDSKRDKIIGLHVASGSWNYLYSFNKDSLKWEAESGYPKFVLRNDFSGEYDTYQDKIITYRTWNSGNMNEIDLTNKTVKQRLDTLGGVQPTKSRAYTSYDTLNKCMVLMTTDSATWAYDSKTETWADMNISSPGSGEGIGFHMTYDPVKNIHFALGWAGWSGLQTRVYALKYRPTGTKIEKLDNVELDKYAFKVSPNPFNPTTTINYSLVKSENIDLAIYNSKGALVRQLYSGTQIQGDYKMAWDAIDSRGYSVSSGVYLLKLKIANKVMIRQICLLR